MMFLSGVMPNYRRGGVLAIFLAVSSKNSCEQGMERHNTEHQIRNNKILSNTDRI